ncbi:MAG: polymer-forming cytoskeletal protein [Nitrospirota bacterium]
MFKKKNFDKLEALVGANSEFRGDITTQGTFRIDGALIGNIAADWVIIGEDGSVRGNIAAKTVVIGGRVEGNIKTEELLEIKHNGKVFGDIQTKTLSIAEGGVFEGHSLAQKVEANVVDFPAKEAAAK